MRLLNTWTGNFEEFQDKSDIPPYAILSHTWSPQGEQTYQDVRNVQEVYKQDVIAQKTPSPISHSTLLPAIQQDVLPEPIASGGGAPVPTIDTIPGGHSESLKGLSTSRLA